MDVTFVTCAYPPDPSYIPEDLQATYEPGDDIDVNTVFPQSLEVGASFDFDGHHWTVTATHEFLPIGHRQGNFRTAIATLDGNSIQRNTMRESNPNYLYCLVTQQEGLAWAMPAKPDYFPNIGDTPSQLQNYQVSESLSFEAETSGAEFDYVRVLICQEAMGAIAA